MSYTSQDAGHGKITAQIHSSQVVFPVLAYTYPLKLLSPRMQQERVGVVYMMTYGGGLVGGDRISLTITIEHDTRLVLLSQVRLFKGLITCSNNHSLRHDIGIYKGVQNKVGRQSRCPLCA
jgi:UreD urease accessory protein